MSFETFNGEHNNTLIFQIYDEVVDDINAEFKDIIKNVPHSREFQVSHQNVFTLLDRKIECHRIMRMKYLKINKKFMRKFVKLNVSYVLKDNDDRSMPPIAIAAINCKIRDEALLDYISYL